MCKFPYTGRGVNFRNARGETALMFAAKKVASECVKILLKSGADVNIVNVQGENVISYALRGNFDGCTLLKGRCPGWTIEYHNASVHALVKAGADVNTCERDGTTLLMRAAQKGCESCVHFLIQAGADVNMCRTDGNSALIYAVTSNCHHCVRSLIEAGADVNVKCSIGDTPLILASKNIYSAKTLKLLVDAGADVNVVSNKGLDTIIPLMHTVADVFNPTILQQAKVLLKAGARINVSGINNQNALEMYITTCILPDKTTVLLLQAAGETSRRMTDDLIHVSSYFQEMDINLKQF